MKPNTHLLAYLLHYANRDIPFELKNEFYEIKQMLLKKYGQKIGQDIQHIKKECHYCDEGVYYSPQGYEACYHCDGTGVYSEFWSILDKYKLGKFEFHNPVEKVYSNPVNKEKSKQIIEGYIMHSPPKYRLGAECTLWLFLFFDRKSFWKRFGRFGCPNNKKTPLIILSNLVWNVHHFKWKNLFPKKKIYPVPLNEFYFADGIDDDLPF